MSSLAYLAVDVVRDDAFRIVCRRNLSGRKFPRAVAIELDSEHDSEHDDREGKEVPI